MNGFKRLGDDETGFVVSIELVLIATIAILGLLAGFTAVRDAVVSELSDVAGAVQDLNQSYSFFGVVGHAASSAGSDYEDASDFCDDAEDTAGEADNCIAFDGDPADEGSGEGAGGGGGGGGGGAVIIRPPVLILDPGAGRPIAVKL